jgi:hypothetical protein
VRYRQAASRERLQLRWFAYGASVAFVSAVVYLAFGVIATPENDFVREATYALFILSLSSLPISVFHAITTHNLYEIDRIIGRTFAYGALTAILAGLYAASVRLFNGLFVAVTGQESEAALVLTTLVLATTFTPIKSRLEKIAAKRFPPELPPASPAIAGVEASATPPTIAAEATAAEVSAAEARAAEVTEPSIGDGAADAVLDARLDARIDARLEAIVRRAVDAALAERDRPAQR